MFELAPLPLIILALIAIALFNAVRALRGFAQVNRDAPEDFAYRHARGMIPAGLSQEGYVRAYKRLHSPRANTYIAVTITALLVLSPIIMTAIGAFLQLIWQIGGQSRSLEPGYLVWQFFIFFLMIAVWAGICYFAARRYHRRAPGTFDQELEREMGLY